MTPVGWQIQVERSGGFTGIPLRGELSSDDLSSADAAELERLAGAVDFDRYQTADSAQEGQPDRFQYHLIVNRGTERHEFTAGEATMDPQLRELIQWLLPRVRRSGAR